MRLRVYGYLRTRQHFKRKQGNGFLGLIILMMILKRKVTFLAKLLSDNNSHRILSSKGDITFSNNVDNLRNTNILEQYLGAYADAIYIRGADWKRTVSTATLHPSLMHICSPQLVYEWICGIKHWNMGYWGTQLPKPKY